MNLVWDDRTGCTRAGAGVSGNGGIVGYTEMHSFGWPYWIRVVPLLVASRTGAILMRESHIECGIDTLDARFVQDGVKNVSTALLDACARMPIPFG